LIVADSKGHYDESRIRQSWLLMTTETKKIIKPAPITLDESIIFEGDALTVLQRIPSNTVQCIVTDPRPRTVRGARTRNNGDQPEGLMRSPYFYVASALFIASIAMMFFGSNLFHKPPVPEPYESLSKAPSSEPLSGRCGAKAESW
jgi:hypothetical protein